LISFIEFALWSEFNLNVPSSEWSSPVRIVGDLNPKFKASPTQDVSLFCGIVKGVAPSLGCQPSMLHS
jgi:hypothetical protein